MIESMQKRASPVNAHRVATQYFDNFRKERQIPDKEHGQPQSGDTSGSSRDKKNTAVTTAVSTAVIKQSGDKVATEEPPRNKRTSREAPSGAPDKALRDTHRDSEYSVYAAMYEECVSRNAESLRFGLKSLMEKTGLSDKTVRVSIHALEEKLNIEMVEPSLGIYGRKFRVYAPQEVLRRREEGGITIDTATKRIETRE